MKKIVSLLVLLNLFIIFSCTVGNDSDPFTGISSNSQSTNYSTIYIKGIVDAFSDPSDDTNGSVEIGSKITGYYIVKNNPVPTPNNTFDSTVTDYLDVVNGGDFKLKVGDYEFISQTNEIVNFQTYNNKTNGNGFYDSWDIFSGYVDILGPELEYTVTIHLSCHSDDESTISSTDLIKKPNLNDWEINRVSIARKIKTNGITKSILFIAGEIQSLEY